jgi:hypothetical protein
MMNRSTLATISFLVCAGSMDARVTRIAIEQQTANGQFETLNGRFYGELDPTDSHNTIITDGGILGYVFDGEAGRYVQGQRRPFI